MIQRFIGVSIGALATFLVLWLSMVVKPADLLPWYLVAVVIGAIVSLAWPAVASFWFGRRAKERRDSAIQRQVERQVAEDRAKRED
jgi:uncharacterized membrane protein